MAVDAHAPCVHLALLMLTLPVVCRQDGHLASTNKAWRQHQGDGGKVCRSEQERLLLRVSVQSITRLNNSSTLSVWRATRQPASIETRT